MINKIGVLTSGGDSPSMNAAIRNPGIQMGIHPLLPLDRTQASQFVINQVQLEAATLAFHLYLDARQAALKKIFYFLRLHVQPRLCNYCFLTDAERLKSPLVGARHNLLSEAEKLKPLRQPAVWHEIKMGRLVDQFTP